MSAIGTVIPQNQGMDYYVQNYPDVDGHRVFGFVTWRLIGLLQFDHIYVTPYFLGLLALLGASLAACTTTRQWPMLRVARRWRFADKPERGQANGTCISEALPEADVRDVGRLLKGKGFQVFLRGKRLYAFKGLAGRMGPIGVHASLLAIMAGVSLSGLGGWKGSVMVPEDGDFVLAQALSPGSPVAQLPKGASRVAHVDSFRINYRPDGSVQQFNSQISVSDLEGRPLNQQEVSVNAPLRVEGVTAYQTDWSIAACVVRAEGSPMMPDTGAALSLPMASLEDQGGVKGRAWATFVPAEPISDSSSQPRGVSIIARDFQSVALYDSQGKFVGVRRPGSNKPIDIEGMHLTVDSLIGATGLELKVDPGVPYVYLGFGGLMLTTIVSYLSHSQIWALQEGSTVHVSGKTNRATVSFTQELSALLDDVPESRPAVAPALKG